MNADSSTTVIAANDEPTTRRMENPTKFHTGKAYTGPKVKKTIHVFKGKAYELTSPMTRSEAEKHLFPKPETPAIPA